MCIEKLPPSAGNLSSNNSFAGDILELDSVDYVDDIPELYYVEADQESSADIFNEYLWMENEEEFEEEEMQRLEEQELILQCNSAMDEMELLDDIRQLECEHHREYILTDVVLKSSLNPFADEFVPNLPTSTI